VLTLYLRGPCRRKVLKCGTQQVFDLGNHSGAPEEIRTPDPQIRSLVLYPAELRARRVLAIGFAAYWQAPAAAAGRRGSGR
jgi:hypothetical protein